MDDDMMMSIHQPTEKVGKELCHDGLETTCS